MTKSELLAMTLEQRHGLEPVDMKMVHPDEWQDYRLLSAFCTDCEHCCGCVLCVNCYGCILCMNCTGIGNGYNLQYVYFGVQLTEHEYNAMIARAEGK